MEETPKNDKGNGEVHEGESTDEKAETPLSALFMSKGVKLYHFTDEGNIESIKETGLVPWTEAQKIDGAKLTSNELSRQCDMENEVADYVRLCFRKDHPMLYIAKEDGRIKKEAWISVSLEILDVKGVKFCNKNAALKNADIRESPEHLRWDLITIDTPFKYVPVEKKPFLQAEVLVPKKIDAKYLTFE